MVHGKVLASAWMYLSQYSSWIFNVYTIYVSSASHSWFHGYNCQEKLKAQQLHSNWLEKPNGEYDDQGCSQHPEGTLLLGSTTGVQQQREQNWCVKRVWLIKKRAKKANADAVLFLVLWRSHSEIKLSGGRGVITPLWLPNALLVI